MSKLHRLILSCTNYFQVAPQYARQAPLLSRLRTTRHRPQSRGREHNEPNDIAPQLHRHFNWFRSGWSGLSREPHRGRRADGGRQAADLPDLTIKEVKVYVTDMTGIHKLNGSETGELISVVTNGGIEGNYTIGDRSTTPGWLEWAKPMLVGRTSWICCPPLPPPPG